eukprot:scaffold22735_cov207-Cylindrotheca_fusiformis.AAC.1
MTERKVKLVRLISKTGKYDAVRARLHVSERSIRPLRAYWDTETRRPSNPPKAGVSYEQAKIGPSEAQVVEAVPGNPSGLPTHLLA